MAKRKGGVLNLKLENLTVAEIEAIEEITGVPLDKLGKADQPKGKMLRAMVYVTQRRKNPDFTMEDAGNFVLNFTGRSEPDPTETDV